MKNKKAFTLVELLAVIVILIILILFAVTIVKKHTLDAKKKSILANSIAYVKAVNTLIVELKTTDNSIIDGNLTVDELNGLGVSISGTKPETGAVIISKSSTIYACLTYEEYRVIYLDGNYSEVTEGECLGIQKDFAYTGSSDTFTPQLSGTYKLEVWGAQGGGPKGGYGGYSVGYIHLTEGQRLHVNVGGIGEQYAGGYNGGGTGGSGSGQWSYGGGGATIIATSKGLLSSFQNNLSALLLVGAGGGGGGGSAPDNAGGNAGGYISNPGVDRGGTAGYNGTAATQSSAGKVYNDNCAYGSFGIGGNYCGGYGGAGGGAGLYGGGGSNRGHGGGGGGSSYINTTALTDAEMYCNNCQESSEAATKTISVDCVSDTPTEFCAKSGAGYARITPVLFDFAS